MILQLASFDGLSAKLTRLCLIKHLLRHPIYFLLVIKFQKVEFLGVEDLLGIFTLYLSLLCSRSEDAVIQWIGFYLFYIIEALLGDGGRLIARHRLSQKEVTLVPLFLLQIRCSRNVINVLRQWYTIGSVCSSNSSRDNRFRFEFQGL